MLNHFRRRLDDFLSILEQHLEKNTFAIGERPSIADISMMAYLAYPADETGYDFATSHPAVSAWLGRIANLPWLATGLRPVTRQAPQALRPGSQPT